MRRASLLCIIRGLSRCLDGNERDAHECPSQTKITSTSSRAWMGATLPRMWWSSRAIYRGWVTRAVRQATTLTLLAISRVGLREPRPRSQTSIMQASISSVNIAVGALASIEQSAFLKILNASTPLCRVPCGPRYRQVRSEGAAKYSRSQGDRVRTVVEAASRQLRADNRAVWPHDHAATSSARQQASELRCSCHSRGYCRGEWAGIDCHCEGYDHSAQGIPEIPRRTWPVSTWARARRAEQCAPAVIRVATLHRHI